MFETILKVAMVIISVALIILCLLQSGKSDDIVNALTVKVQIFLLNKKNVVLI